MTKRAAQTHKWFVTLANGETVTGTSSSLELATKAMNAYRATIAKYVKMFPGQSAVESYGVDEI